MKIKIETAWLKHQDMYKSIKNQAQHIDGYVRLDLCNMAKDGYRDMVLWCLGRAGKSATQQTALRMLCCDLVRPCVDIAGDSDSAKALHLAMDRGTPKETLMAIETRLNAAAKTHHMAPWDNAKYSAVMAIAGACTTVALDALDGWVASAARHACDAVDWHAFASGRLGQVAMKAEARRQLEVLKVWLKTQPDWQ